MIEIAGKQYQPKSSDELTGADWRRMMLSLESAVAEPDHLVPMLRSVAVVACPAAETDAPLWTDAQVFYAVGAAITHLGECCGLGADVMRRYVAASEILAARFRELCRALPAGRPAS